MLADSFAAFPAPSLLNLAVVLVRPRNPLNIGAVARAMSNFGCEDLRLVAVHRPSHEGAAAAVGPAEEIYRNAKLFATLPEAVADCSLVLGTLAPHVRLPQQPMVPLPQALGEVCSVMAASRVAVVFGSEKTGLSNEDFSYCQRVVGIPSRAQHASMNLGQAAAIFLYAIATAAQPQSLPAADALATAGDVDRLTQLLASALHHANEAGVGRSWTEQNLRALICRMRIPAQDASAVSGMLRKILWTLEQK